MIPYGRQHVTAEDVDAVVSVLKSDWLTQGPLIPQFERAVASYCGVPHAVAVNSATSALHIACLALELGSGDRLWTSANTFAASAQCALYCGAEVDFVDIDGRTYNMDVAALAAKLERAATEDALPRIVVPVHFAGASCDMQQIHALAQRYGFKIIEDASHAVGSRYLEEPVGSCRFSDIAVFSFHPVKLITTGEGGMALTADAGLAERMSRLRTHGITREPSLFENPSEGAWYYEQLELGYNYRLTDIQAALGLSQISRLDQNVARRQEIARRYDDLVADLPVVTPFRSSTERSALHLYPIWIDKSRTNRSRREIFDGLRAAGIGVNVHYIPVHLHPIHRRRGFLPGDFPEAERYYAGAISLPMYATLSDEEQDRVVAALRGQFANDRA
jgi:UDP-4-amino-4,6-dideoxy-N-acetyl-beta-L-altrosamine transaminase